MDRHTRKHVDPQGADVSPAIFPILGGIGVAAVGLGILASSTALTALGVVCAACAAVGQHAHTQQQGDGGQPSTDSEGQTEPAGQSPQDEQQDVRQGEGEAEAGAPAQENFPERAEGPAQAAEGGAEGDGTLPHADAHAEDAQPARPAVASRVPQSTDEDPTPQQDQDRPQADGSNADEAPDDGPEGDGPSRQNDDAPEDAPDDVPSQLASADQPDELAGEDQGEEVDPDVAKYLELRQKLMESSDPMGLLKLWAADVHRREIDADVDPDSSDAPKPVESYLARRLDEAGLQKDDVRLPPIRVVSPRRTHLLYLRTNGSMTYGAKLRVIALEAALNSYAFVCSYFKKPGNATLTQVYQLVQGLTSSVCAQIPNITMELPREGQPLSDPDGEWMVREVLGQAIETVHTPYRLTATYRSNVACGDVAIQVDLTPASVFPGTAWVEGLGIVPTTSDMRRQEASRYALRMGIMLAACAFHASQRVRHVWVQGVIDTPTSHDCYYHARIDRSSFRWIEMDHIVDPIQCLLCLGGALRHENGILQPIEDGFSLDDQRFCPPGRFEPVALSTRRLPARYAYALGTDQVSGLAISDEDERQAVADDVVRHLSDSTEKNVRMIFDLADQTGDPVVEDAARRTAGKLIDGSISDDDALAVHEEFVSGDELTQAMDLARRQLGDQDYQGAAATVAAALKPIDDARTYEDTDQVKWRAFDSYVDRALYNRLHVGDSRQVRLVPHTYLEAHMTLAIALLAQGNIKGALEHARRGHELAPISSWTALNLVTCLQATGQDDAAIQQLDDLLRVAHDPQGIGIAYYQMAHLQWSRGNLLAARACFERIPQSMGQLIPSLGSEMGALLAENGGEESPQPLDESTSRQILAQQDIPVAPSERIAHYFYEGMAASFDAEVFPVAKNFVEQLGELSGDDVVMNVIRSVEGEPDR